MFPELENKMDGSTHPVKANHSKFHIQITRSTVGKGAKRLRFGVSLLKVYSSSSSLLSKTLSTSRQTSEKADVTETL